MKSPAKMERLDGLHRWLALGWTVIVLLSGTTGCSCMGGHTSLFPTYSCFNMHVLRNSGCCHVAPNESHFHWTVWQPLTATPYPVSTFAQPDELIPYGVPDRPAPNGSAPNGSAPNGSQSNPLAPEPPPVDIPPVDAAPAN